MVYFFPNYAKNYPLFENLKKEIKSKNIYAKLAPIELDLEMTIVGKLRLMQCCSYLKSHAYGKLNFITVLGLHRIINNGSDSQSVRFVPELDQFR